MKYAKGLECVMCRYRCVKKETFVKHLKYKHNEFYRENGKEFK